MDPTAALEAQSKAIEPPERPITGAELYAMGNLGSSELVQGRIVPKMPTGHPHGFIENVIGALLYIYLAKNRIGRALSSEVGIFTRRDPDTVRAADVAFISNERLQQVTSHSFLDVAPELVVEIMSPSDSWSEVQAKLAEYLAIDVKVVWVVDPQLEQVHVYHGPEQVKLLQKQDELSGEDVLPGLTIPLTEIFVE